MGSEGLEVWELEVDSLYGVVACKNEARRRMIEQLADIYMYNCKFKQLISTAVGGD